MLYRLQTREHHDAFQRCELGHRHHWLWLVSLSAKCYKKKLLRISTGLSVFPKTETLNLRIWQMNTELQRCNGPKSTENQLISGHSGKSRYRISVSPLLSILMPYCSVIVHELLDGHLPFLENGRFSIVKAARCQLELPYPYWSDISDEG